MLHNTSQNSWKRPFLTFFFHYRTLNSRWVVVTTSSSMSSFSSTSWSSSARWLSSALAPTSKSKWTSTWTSLETPTWTPRWSWSSSEESCFSSVSLDVAELALKILVWCTLTVPYLLWSWLPWLVSLWPLLSSRLVSYK